MKPEIGITTKHLHKSIKLLENILADEMILYVKTRKLHWNVTGNSFMEMHKLFQSQYTELEKTIDTVTERISKLGGKTIGTMQEYLKATRLKENPGKYPTQKEMLTELLHDHENVIKYLRKDIGECSEKLNDAGTTDFLTSILEQHETTAWILRRYLM